MVRLALTMFLLVHSMQGASDPINVEWRIVDLPSSEQVKGIESCGRGIVVATENDLYRSQGDGFVPVVEGLRHKAVHDVLEHEGVVDVATATGGIFRSTDRGLTWTARPMPDSAVNVLRLVSNGRTDVALTGNGTLYVRNGVRGTWRRSNAPSSVKGVRDVAVDGPRYVVITDSGDVAALEANGRWTHIGRIPCRSLRPLISIHGNDAVIIADSVMYRWTRKREHPFDTVWVLPGDRWGDVCVADGIAVAAGRPRDLISINVTSGEIKMLPNPGKAEDRIGTVYWDGRTMMAGIDRGAGGLYVMPFGIREWRRIALQTTKATDASVRRITMTNGTIYVCMLRDGVYEYDATSRRVDQRHQGVRNSAIATLHRISDHIIATSRTMGAYVVDACGASVTNITASLPRGEGFATTVVGNSIYTSVGRVGLWRSDDMGRRWNHVRYPDTTVFIDRLDVLGSDVIASARQRSYISTDRGMTWSRFRVANDTSLLRWTANGAHGLAMIGTVDGAWLRSSASAAWTRIETPFTTAINHRFGNGIIHGSTLILGSKEQLLVSRDLGATWVPMPIANATYATHVALTDGTLYVVTDGGKLLSAPFK